MNEEVEQVVAETKSEFNLMDRLKNRPVRTAEVTVFTDEVLGARHEELAQELADARASEAEPDSYANLAAETKRVANLAAETAITFKLRAVPDIVAQAARRKTRKTLGIKGQIQQEQLEAFSDLYVAQMLSDSTESYKDHQSGVRVDGLSLDEAQALKDHLPYGEFTKLDNAMSDLSLRSHIASSLSEDADF